MKTICHSAFKALILLAITCVSAKAAEFRTWTSIQGSSIEAQLVSYKEGNVNLTTKEPKPIKLKVTDLSLADRQYLVEFADADEDLLYKSPLTTPEHQYRKPKDFIKKLEEQMILADLELEFDLYETEHFFFACAKGVNPKGIAETAEACWHGMAFQHYEFRENWGPTKYLVILPEDREQYTMIGGLAVAQLQATGQQGQAQAQNLAQTWNLTGSNRLLLPRNVVEKHKLKAVGSVFNTVDSKNYRKKFNSFQTHVISNVLFTVQMGVLSPTSNGQFAISTGHAYYKEIQLSKKTETNLISQDYEEGIGSKSGFKDGTSWAKSLRSMVRKGELEPNILEILAIKQSNELTPPKLVTMYALSSYLQSSQKRIANYATFVRLTNSSKQIPAPSEMANIFGFDSVEDFQADWVEFIKSRDFK